MKLAILTTLTMIAFAFNSVLARLALAGNEIDPASYSAIRLISGALVLALLVNFSKGFLQRNFSQGNWWSAFLLFAYAAAFSFSYINIETGIGALILFTCVQATMIGWSIHRKSYPTALEWLGIAIALGAFIWLVSPGFQSPDPWAAVLMAVSGISWGLYTVRGKSAADPLKATMGNFLRSVPFALMMVIAFAEQLNISFFGLAMAILSGAVTSGLGYALWYYVLGTLNATKAAIVQLTVPIIAGVGGSVFLSEQWTFRFVIASVLILGGVAITILASSKKKVRDV